MEPLGARLKRFREISGKTQAQVRDALGLGKVAMSEYENEKTAPSEDIIRRLAEEYGVTAAVLRYGEEALGEAASQYWAGYADAILGVLEDATNRQRRLVAGLRGSDRTRALRFAEDRATYDASPSHESLDGTVLEEQRGGPAADAPEDHTESG